MSSGRIEGASELWTTYFGDTPQDQVYWDARKRQDEWGDMYNSLCRHARERRNCMSEAELAEWQRQMVAANAALLRHGGVPDEWIDEWGCDCAPLDLCRICWQPGAIDADGCGGCTEGYHPACLRSQAVRGDLRVAAYARINGDEDRAVEWERIALVEHNASAESEPCPHGSEENHDG